MIEQSAQPTRPRFTWAIALLIVAVLAGIATWILITSMTSKTSTASTAAMTSTQSNEGGQVTIAATWQGSGAGTIFTIEMNTHAVDLDGYDLKQLAVLRIDGGTDIHAISWEAPKGGHHRTGTLTFPATGTDGKPLAASDARTIELVIRDVAGVPERVFAWRQ